MATASDSDSMATQGQSSILTDTDTDSGSMASRARTRGDNTGRTLRNGVHKKDTSTSESTSESPDSSASPADTDGDLQLESPVALTSHAAVPSFSMQDAPSDVSSSSSSSDTSSTGSRSVVRPQVTKIKDCWKADSSIYHDMAIWPAVGSASDANIILGLKNSDASVVGLCPPQMRSAHG